MKEVQSVELFFEISAISLQPSGGFLDGDFTMLLKSRDPAGSHVVACMRPWTIALPSWILRSFTVSKGAIRLQPQASGVRFCLHASRLSNGSFRYMMNGRWIQLGSAIVQGRTYATTCDPAGSRDLSSIMKSLIIGQLYNASVAIATLCRREVPNRVAYFLHRVHYAVCVYRDRSVLRQSRSGEKLLR